MLTDVVWQRPTIARITARAENHLAQIEWRLLRIGQAVAVGGADRGLVADRLRAVRARANLGGGVPK